MTSPVMHSALYVGPRTARPIVTARVARDRGTRVGWSATLTPREAQVTGLIAQGLSDKEIARLLMLSPRTVEAHVASALRKTDCRSRTELAIRLIKETFNACA